MGSGWSPFVYRAPSCPEVRSNESSCTVQLQDGSVSVLESAPMRISILRVHELHGDEKPTFRLCEEDGSFGRGSAWAPIVQHRRVLVG